MAEAANPYAAPAAQVASQDEGRRVSKALLLALTFFGGGLGAHKFYLGKYWHSNGPGAGRIRDLRSERLNERQDHRADPAARPRRAELDLPAGNAVAEIPAGGLPAL